MERVVVTGGGGFIGSAIARALLARGAEVTVIGRSRYPALQSMGINCVQGDITDSPFMEHALAGADTVFHVAALAGVWGRAEEYMHANVTGTAVCLKSCRKNRVPVLVYTSTPSVVFERKDLEGVDEKTPYARHTLCPYQTSKIIAEKLVLQANGDELRTVAIRPHLVYGPGDPHLVPRLLERAKAGQLRRIGPGTNRVDVAHIDNVVQAHLRAADVLRAGGDAAGRAFFIADREPVRLWEWIDTLLNGFGLEPVRGSVPLPVARVMGAVLERVWHIFGLPGEPKMTRFVALQLGRSHWFSHRAAEELLGYAPQVSGPAGMESLFADPSLRRICGT